MPLNVDTSPLFNPWITDSGHIGGVVVLPMCPPKFCAKNKPMREFHSSNSLEPPPTEIEGRYAYYFRSVIGFYNLTDNIFTAKPRYAQGLLRYDNACFNDYADN